MTEAWTATSPVRPVAVGVGLVLTLAGCSLGGLSLGSSNQSGAGASSSGSVAASPSASAAGSPDPTPTAPSSPAQPGVAAGTAAPVPNAAGILDGPAFSAWLTANARRAGGAHMVMSTRTAQGAVSAVGDLRLSDTAVQESVVMKVGAQSMRMLLLPDRLYMSVSSVKLPVGKRWILISATGTDRTSLAMRPLFQTLQSDSLTSGDGMKGVAVRRVGVTAFGGVPVTRYTFASTQAQIDAAVQAAPAADRARIRAALAGMTTSTSMLVDAGGLTRQVVRTTMLKGRRTVSTTSYSRWGTQVSITAPPPAEVVAASSLS